MQVPASRRSQSKETTTKHAAISSLMVLGGSSKIRGRKIAHEQSYKTCMRRRLRPLNPFDSHALIATPLDTVYTPTFAEASDLESETDRFFFLLGRGAQTLPFWCPKPGRAKRANSRALELPSRA